MQRLHAEGENTMEPDEKTLGLAAEKKWAEAILEIKNNGAKNWFNVLFQLSHAPDHLFEAIGAIISTHKGIQEEIRQELAISSATRIASYGKDGAIRAFFNGLASDPRKISHESVATQILLCGLAYGQPKCMIGALLHLKERPMISMDPFESITVSGLGSLLSLSMAIETLASGRFVTQEDKCDCLDIAILAGLQTSEALIAEMESRINYPKDRAGAKIAEREMLAMRMSSPEKNPSRTMTI